MNSLSETPTLRAESAPSRSRSQLVTVFAWCLMVVGGLLVPVSAISLLMLLVGSYGSAEVTFSGTLLVVGGPSMAAATGFGLLRRWKWGYYGALMFLLCVAVWNGVTLARGSKPERTYISPSGVRTTVLATHVNAPLHLAIVALCLGMGVKLAGRRVREEFSLGVPRRGPEPLVAARPSMNTTSLSAVSQKWRVGHQGRDEMYYEENVGDGWRRLRLGGEMLMGEAHHVIYFDSPKEWANYPEWARHRRDEIIGRIKSEFRAPDYEYSDPGAPTTIKQTPTTRAVPTTATSKQMRALWIAITLMLALGSGLGWLAVSGFERERTYFPSKRASQQRIVQRKDEPALYWFSLGLYATLSIGAFGLAAWGMREARR